MANRSTGSGSYQGTPSACSAMLRNHSMASGTSTTDGLAERRARVLRLEQAPVVRDLLEVLDDLEHDLGALQLRLEAPLAGVEGAARGGDGAPGVGSGARRARRAITSSVEGLITS